jgi:hypothetical protein
MTDTQPETTTGGGQSKPMKTIVLVLALLLAEAAAIVGTMMLVGGKPDVASAAEGMADGELVEGEKIVEILVLDAKLPNAKTGVTYLYATEIYAQVKQKHAERVEQELEQFYNEIKAELTAVWRTSDPRHFQEPKLENLTRKVYALLNDRFGVDQEDGEPILVKCVIVMGTGFRVDS